MKQKHFVIANHLRQLPANLLTFFGIFAGAVILCTIFRHADGIEGYASPVFVLAVLLISRFTDGYLYGMAAAILSVICVNYFFTYPYLKVNFSISGYPLTFLSLLVVSLITSTLTSQVKQQKHLKMQNEREKIRADLLRSVSHDIRTPLTSITGAASTLLHEPDRNNEASYLLLQDIEHETQWLIRMVENLLSITKLEGNHVIIKDEWAAEEILGEVAGKLRKTYPDMPLSVYAQPEAVFIPMDPILIEQVLFNLAENSWLHGRNVTQIVIIACDSNNQVVFSIEDNGGGFEPEQLRAIRKGRCPSKETDTDKNRGMGLGLRVCQAIVTAHGGQFRVENAGSGARVWFSLPEN